MESMRETPVHWGADWQALLAWGQVVVTVLGMTVVWLLYVSLVLRFTWLPSIRDSLLPFGIGILEFLMIDLVGRPDHLGLWFYALAAVFVLATFTGHITFKSARAHGSNREFFDAVEPASLRDFVPSAVVAGGFAVFGTMLELTGSQGWLAFWGLLSAIVALAYETEMIRRYWALHLSLSEPSESEQPPPIPE